MPCFINMNFYDLCSINDNDNQMHIYNVVFHSLSLWKMIKYSLKTIFASWKKKIMEGFYEICETRGSVMFIPWKNIIYDISKKCISPNKIKALITFGKMHFLGISVNNFFHEIKCNRITSFMEFIIYIFVVVISETK